jgi:hypothetical protein
VVLVLFFIGVGDLAVMPLFLFLFLFLFFVVFVAGAVFVAGDRDVLFLLVVDFGLEEPK